MTVRRKREIAQRMAQINITVLTENSVAGGGLLAEHGLAFWIETGGVKILFDTGQGKVLKNNARILGIRPASADAVVLSHGHYDHTGGLPDTLTDSKKIRVYAHPGIFEPKYARRTDGTVSEIGIPARGVAALRTNAEMVPVEGPTEVAAGFRLTGPIPRINDYEDTGGPFFRDRECSDPDPITDDQAAFLETQNGTVVVLGCAHAGVVNTLRFVQTLTSGRPIHAVLGGMHLLNAGAQRTERTIEAFRRLNIRRLMPCHCTGSAAMARLQREFPEQYEVCVAGSFIRFEA